MFIAQRSRIFSSLKNTSLVLTQRALQTRGDRNTIKLLSATSTMQLLDPKSFHMTPTCCTSTIENVQPMGLMERVLQKIGIIDIQKYKYMALGFRVYEHVVNQIDFPFFFKYFNMADTYFSWFLVTELHVWMIMVRYMAEGKTGNLIRNKVVEAMWEDTKARTENLGTISSKMKSTQLRELSHQFNAAIIGYDEGIQSDDKVLAGALWRRFFHLECNNPEHIEILLIYVRKQIYLFDNLPTEEILKKPVLKLVDIKSLCKSLCKP